MTPTDQLADLTARLKQAEAERDEWKFNYGNSEQVYCDRIAYIQKERDAAIAKLADVEKDLKLSAHERALHTSHQQKWLADLEEARAERDALRSRLTEVKAGAAAMREALSKAIASVEALKLPCSDNPESAQAIRNGHYMSIALNMRAALSSTAGTELLEDLKTLRKALKQYADPGNWHVGSKYDGESRSFTGPEEARKALDETERGDGQ